MSERPARLRFAAAAVLGAATALLASCGSTGTGLIPASSAGPLQGDFEEVVQAAKNGNTSCAATETALAKTEGDFTSLPSTVSPALRKRLQEGITKLHSDALTLCRQPSPGATATSTAPATTNTSPSTTPTVTEPTTPQTTSTPTTTPAPTGPTGPTSTPETGGAEASPGGEGGGDGGSGGNEGGK